MYRPEIKVLDCSVRDGGLINKWQFSDELVRETYIKCAAAGIDYVEIGYKADPNLFDPKEYGKWRFCREEDVRSALEGVELTAKLSCLVDIGRVRDEDFPPCEQSMFDLVRVACYLRDVDKGIALAESIMAKGYALSLNIMAVSTNLEKDIDEALAEIAATDIPCVYVVDSYGSMYSEDITWLVKKYQTAMPGKTIGIHTHNNRQLAFANTIQAIIDGADMLDASIFGIGRGAGNCPLELLIGFLKNPKFDLRPVLQVLEKHYLPLTKEIEWGYLLPYAITGMLNQHPRTAIACRNSDQKDNYVSFYDKLTTPEVVD
ncbi:MAG: aldolase catalytic domain-containing protein [Lentisphaeria bacterium]|nr:aldolase catalytic domain-containing protein [Lentisphaeria bacterium]